MPASIRVEHINPFIKATQETFRTMVHTEAHPGRIMAIKGSGLLYDISGIIGLGGGAKGSVTLSFPRLAALRTVGSFVGDKVLALDETVKDAIGELANIIAGAAKRDLSQYRIYISLPTVVIGTGHEIQGGKDILPLAVPFESEFGTFFLIVSFRSEA